MKRACSLLLTALLLAGCTAAPAASGSAATTEAPAASAESAAAGEALRPLLPGDRQQYYMTEVTEGDLVRYVVTDLTAHETAVPCDVGGCEHDTADCPATFTRGECDAAYVLDEDTLVAFTRTQFPAEGDGQVVLMDRNCQNRRTLTASSDSLFDVTPIYRPAYTDGQYLYCFGYHGNFGSTPAVYRIDLETGARERRRPGG